MLSNVIWKEFPEINRKIAFTYNHISPNLPLGCHCGSISGVSATLGSGYYAANKGRNIEVLDSAKEPELEYKLDKYSYNALYTSNLKELKAAALYLRGRQFAFSEISKDAYMDIVEKCKHYPLWVMSDVINYQAPVRKQGLMEDTVYEVFGSTGDFAKWLIDNKIGYVMASPIIQNPSHRSKSNYSLNQGWFWVPPGHMARAIDAGGIFGSAGFPPEEEWLKTIGGDIGLVDSEKILNAVFNDGKFPEITRTLIGRGTDGRFKRREAVTEA